MSDERDSKHHYSYKEMVDRLRDNRPEGSRVKSEEREVDPETGKVTVRRQKRRRTGKTKSGLLHDPKWFRLFRRLGYVGLPVVLALLVVTYFVVAASTGTGRFQEGVGRALIRDLGLESASIRETKLRGLNLLAGEATMDGKAGAMVRGAVLQEVEMRLSPGSFLGGSWDVEACAIGNLKLLLAAPRAAAVASASLPSRFAAGFLLADEPSRIHFRDVTVAQAEILFGQPANPSAAARDALPGLRKVRASLLERIPEDGSPPYFTLQIGGGRDGSLTLPGWPVFRIESLGAEMRADATTLSRSVFRFAEPVETKLLNSPIGFVEAKGRVPHAAGSTAEIILTLRDVSLADLLPKNTSRYLSGTLHSEALRLSWKTSDPSNSWTIEGPVSFRRVQIRDLKVFSSLEQITAGELGSLNFDEGTAVLTISGAGTRLGEIRAEGIGRASLTGEIKVEPNGKLEGQIQLGVSRESISDSAPPFFKAGEDSSFWTPVTLGGTTTNPTEDLSARIEEWSATQPGGAAGLRGLEEEEEMPGLIPEPTAPAAPGAPSVNEEKVLEDLYNDVLKGE